MMLHIGCHLSCSNGYLAMGKQALALGADTFQFFTRNPRGGSVKPFDESDAHALNVFMEEHHFAPILAHAPYTLNACAADESIRDFAVRTMTEDLARLSYLPRAMLNFHPGSHLKKIEPEACLALIADSINWTLAQTEGVTAVIENTAGQGSNLGYTFEQIASIIERVEDKSRVGVCIDTAHTLAAGYEIRTPEGFAETFRHFDEVIGFSYLRGIHLNDSKKELATHVDRHDSVGKGVMGMELFRLLMNDARFDNIPIVLETPDESLWADEIKLLYSLIEH